MHVKYILSDGTTSNLSATNYYDAFMQVTLDLAIREGVVLEKAIYNNSAYIYNVEVMGELAKNELAQRIERIEGYLART